MLKHSLRINKKKKGSLDSSERVIEEMKQGLNCAQCVLGDWADDAGIDVKILYAISSGFGGGMGKGDTCGCVTGALMALGLKYGDDKLELKEKIQTFTDRFEDEHGSIYCRNLLGLDISQLSEEERNEASIIMSEKCPRLIKSAQEMLNDIMI